MARTIHPMDTSTSSITVNTPVPAGRVSRCGTRNKDTTITTVITGPRRVDPLKTAEAVLIRQMPNLEVVLTIRLIQVVVLLILNLIRSLRSLDLTLVLTITSCPKMPRAIR